MAVINPGGGHIVSDKLDAILRNAGAPTNNVTYLGVAGVGTLLMDTSTGILYSCILTNGSTTVTWQKVGLQT